MGNPPQRRPCKIGRRVWKPNGSPSKTGIVCGSMGRQAGRGRAPFYKEARHPPLPHTQKRNALKEESPMTHDAPLNKEAPSPDHPIAHKPCPKGGHPQHKAR